MNCAKVLCQSAPALRAGAHPLFQREQHDGLHVHAEVGPLARLHLGIDGEKQADRRTKEYEVRSS